MKKVTLEIDSDIKKIKLYIPPKSTEINTISDHCFSYNCSRVIDDCTQCIISSINCDYLAKYLHGEISKVSKDETCKFVIFEKVLKKKIDLFVPNIVEEENGYFCDTTKDYMNCCSGSCTSCSECVYNEKYITSYVESTLK